MGKDINQIARMIVDRVVEKAEQNQDKSSPKEPTEAEIRSAAAKLIGRLGGLKGGPARKKSLTAKRRKEIARKAIATRWSRVKKSRQIQHRIK